MARLLIVCVPRGWCPVPLFLSLLIISASSVLPSCQSWRSNFWYSYSCRNQFDFLFFTLSTFFKWNCVRITELKRLINLDARGVFISNFTFPSNSKNILFINFVNSGQSQLFPFAKDSRECPKLSVIVLMSEPVKGSPVFILYNQHITSCV